MNLRDLRTLASTLTGLAEQYGLGEMAPRLRRFDLTQQQLQAPLLTLAEALKRTAEPVQQEVMGYLRRGTPLSQLGPEAQQWVGRIYPELFQLSQKSLAAIGPPTAARSTKGIRWTLPETTPEVLSVLPPLYPITGLQTLAQRSPLRQWLSHVGPGLESVRWTAKRVPQVSPTRSPFELPPSVGAALARLAPEEELRTAPAYLEAFAHKAARRIAGTQVFGRDFADLNQLVAKLPREDSYKVARLLEAFFHPPSDPLGAQRIAGTFMSIQAGLALSGIGPLLANTSQVFWVGVVNGFRNLAKGLARYLQDPQYRQVIRELAEVPYVSATDLRELLGISRSGPAVDRFTKLLIRPFREIESKIVARSGLLAADQTLEAFRRQPTNPEIIRRLQRLGLTRGEIAALATGRAPQDLVTYARLGLADDAVFFPIRSRRPSLPAHYPTLDIAFQFKGFAMNLGRLIYRHVLGEARHGNYRPLIRMLVGIGLGGTAVGEIIRNIQALISGRPRPVPRGRHGLLRLLEDLSAVGGVGIASDLLLRLLGSDDAGLALLSFLAGPSLSTLRHIGGAAYGALSAPAYENPTERAYRALRRITGILGGPLDVGDWLVSPTGPLPDPSTSPWLRPSRVGWRRYAETVLGLSPEADLLEQRRGINRLIREKALPYRLRAF